MTGRLRIRIHCTRYPHWGSRSGIQQFAKYLDTSAFDVRLVYAPDDDSDFPSLPKWARRHVKAHVQRSGMAWYKLSDLSAEARTYIQCLAGQIDIAHFLDGEHGVQYLPRWVQRMRRPPVVVATYHQPTALLGKLVDRDVLECLSGITVVSPEQLSFFAGVKKASPVYIPHGIDTSFFVPPDRQARTGLRCLTVGHWLRDYEALAVIARAFCDDPKVSFDVVTSNPPKSLALPNVRVLSGVSDEELRNLYWNADVLVMPLLDTTANNALLEGMACGLPIVVSDLPGARAYVPADGGVFIARGDTADFIRSIKRLQNDQGACLAMSNIVRMAAVELSWPRIAKRFEQYYRNVWLARNGLQAAAQCDLLNSRGQTN